MADKLMRAQVILEKDSSIPADAVVNTFYFDGDDSEEPDATYHSAVTSMLSTFYSAIDQLFSSTLSGVGHIKIYDMRDAMPRTPELVYEISLSPGSGDPLPDEIACVLSFSADVASGEAAARRRGRVYLGPLDQDIGAIIDNAYRLQATHLTTIANAAHTMAQGVALPVTGSVKWAIYSPTLDAGGTVDDAFNDVTHGFVDNAFDVQRRRGVKASARTTYTD